MVAEGSKTLGEPCLDEWWEVGLSWSRDLNDVNPKPMLGLVITAGAVGGCSWERSAALGDAIMVFVIDCTAGVTFDDGICVGGETSVFGAGIESWGTWGVVMKAFAPTRIAGLGILRERVELAVCILGSDGCADFG